MELRRGVFPNILSAVLTIFPLLGAEVFSHYSPVTAAASNMAKHGRETLDIYNNATLKILPSTWERVISVGHIHEPGENASALVEEVLLLFRCYMMNMSKLPLPENVTMRFSEASQKIEHLRDCLGGRRNDTCKQTHMLHLKTEYKKQEFGRKLLILYIRWMEKLQTLLLHRNCKE